MGATEKGHWLELLFPVFRRRAAEIRSLRKDREQFAILAAGLKDENASLVQRVGLLTESDEELQRQIEKQEKAKEELQQQVERRDQIIKEVQRQIEKQEKAKEGLQQQVERRDQIVEELQKRTRKQDEVIEKLQKNLAAIQLEREEVYDQYNRLLKRSSEPERVAEGSHGCSIGNSVYEGQSEAVENQGWRLNMGCGRVKKPGYLNVDVDASVKPDLVLSLDLSLPFASNIFELVEAYHVIEHVYPWTTLDILKEFWRILKPGGRVAIECPSIEAACYWLGRNSQYDWGSQMGMWAIYGDPNPKNQLQMHKWGYTPVTLAEILNDVGFVKIQRQVPETHVPARDFRMTATKPVSSTG